MTATPARWLVVLVAAAAVACGKGKDGGAGSGSAPASGSSRTKTIDNGSDTADTAEPAGSAKPAAAPADAGAAAAVPAPTKRDPEAAKAANARGMQLHTAKKYKEAMAEFEKAIAADDSSVVAHYNLACAASRAQDNDVTTRELTWVNSAAAWNDAAAAAMKKAPTDPDLAWFFGLGESSAFLAQGTPLVVDLADIGGNKSEPAVPPDVAKALAAAPGKHDDQCDPNDQKQSRVHAVKAGKRIVYVSLRDGIALFDGSKLMSRTDPIGCTGPGASQDSIESVDTTAALDPAMKNDLVVVRYANGGHRSFTDNVTVAAYKDDDHLVRAFDATLSTSDDDKPGTLELTLNGQIVLGQPGVKQKRVFRWSTATSKFEEVK